MEKDIKAEIKAIIKKVILTKITNYSPETSYKPFFQAIFSDEQVLTHSVVHSFYTSFGISIYEQLASKIAIGSGFEAKTQYILTGEIDQKTESRIQKIDLDLRSKKREPNRLKETQEIKDIIKKGRDIKDPDSVIDLYIKKPNGTEYFIDITSPKPNMKEFVALKKKLLRWTALRLSTDSEAKIIAAIALPYNPYHPKPYSRWTIGNMYDKEQIIIGEDFWNLVGDGNIYEEFLEIFKEVGKELKQKIKEISN